VDDESSAERMKDVFLFATDLIGFESVPDVSLPGDAQLAQLRSRVVELINSAETTPGRRAEAYELLTSIHQLQHLGLETALTHQLSTLSDIRDGIDELAGLSPRELIDAAPVRTCRDLSFGRAMTSTISGSIWLPQHLHIEEDRGAETSEFEQFVDGARIPLSDAPLETELIRRRTAALVPDPASDKRTHQALIGVSRSWSYVAAPITFRGRAIGMLHADRPKGRGAITRDDLELLATFAECLSIVFESAFLQERMEQQVRRATETYAQVVSMLDGVDDAQAAPIRFPGPAQRPTPYPQPTVAGTGSLTSREREVLAHLATGATNAQIARNLVISEATIKSHLKQISKKLGTSSRAAAVAAYARMTQGPYGIAQ
jgi:DNA-binding CsgD family transcriptional regulator/GAF domain-containing protein